MWCIKKLLFNYNVHNMKPVLFFSVFSAGPVGNCMTFNEDFFLIDLLLGVENLFFFLVHSRDCHLTIGTLP